MKLSELAAHLDARWAGDREAEISSVASLQEAGCGDVSFLSNERYADQVGRSEASAVIVPAGFDGAGRADLLFVADVDEALEKVLSLLAPAADVPAVGVASSACVASTAKLGADVAVGAHAVIGERVQIEAGTVIGAGCFVGRDVRIGSQCQLGPHVVIGWGCRLGSNVIIHGNSTIGTDGFGYRLVEGRHRKIRHIGIVVIEDDVEIGSNSCVDRAKFGETVVGRGTKVDDLVMIAHNVRIGENCIIVSQAGIAGSSELGKYVVLAGQCGVGDHVKIGDGAMAGAQTGIGWDVPAGAKVIGPIGIPVRDFFRQQALLKKLPDMAKEIKQLRKKIDEIELSKDHS